MFGQQEIEPSNNSFRPPAMDEPSRRVLYAMGSLVDKKEAIKAKYPGMVGVIDMFQHFNIPSKPKSSPNSNLTSIWKSLTSRKSDPRFQTMILASEGFGMMDRTDHVFWQNMKLLANDSGPLDDKMILSLKVAEAFNRVFQSLGSFWWHKLADEAKSGEPNSITGLDGVHMQDMIIDNSTDTSAGIILQQSLTQLSLELLKNLHLYADTNFFSRDVKKGDSYAETSIKRTSNPDQRKVIKEEAQDLLRNLTYGGISTSAKAEKTWILTEVTPADTQLNRTSEPLLQPVVELDDFSSIKSFLVAPSQKIRIIHPLGLFCEVTKEFFEKNETQLKQIMEFRRFDELKNNIRHIEGVGKNIEGLDWRDIKDLFFDEGTLTFSYRHNDYRFAHITKAFAERFHSHDLSIWFDELGNIKDRNFSFKQKGLAAIKTRIVNTKGEYVDLDVAQVQTMNHKELEDLCLGKKPLPSAQKDIWNTDPPVFVISYSEGETPDMVLRQLADQGRALAHINLKKRRQGKGDYLLEVHNSHGAADGVEARWMNLGVAYAVGGHGEHVETDITFKPKHQGNELDFSTATVTMEIPTEQFFNQIQTINYAFQRPVRSEFAKFIQGIKVPDEYIKTLCDMLFPKVGLPQLITMVAEKHYGGTTNCVKPLRPHHRLNLALAPSMDEDLYKKLTTKTNPEDFIKEISPKDIRALQRMLLGGSQQISLFSRLGISHLQLLYLATQKVRGFTRVIAGRLAQKLAELTDITCQFSGLGRNNERGWFAKRPNQPAPSLRSFVSASSAEELLGTSIGNIGDVFTFRHKANEELINRLPMNKLVVLNPAGDESRMIYLQSMLKKSHLQEELDFFSHVSATWMGLRDYADPKVPNHQLVKKIMKEGKPHDKMGLRHLIGASMIDYDKEFMEKVKIFIDNLEILAKHLQNKSLPLGVNDLFKSLT